MHIYVIVFFKRQGDNKLKIQDGSYFWRWAEHNTIGGLWLLAVFWICIWEVNSWVPLHYYALKHTHITYILFYASNINKNVIKEKSIVIDLTESSLLSRQKVINQIVIQKMWSYKCENCQENWERRYMEHIATLGRSEKSLWEVTFSIPGRQIRISGLLCGGWREGRERDLITEGEQLLTYRIFLSVEACCVCGCCLCGSPVISVSVRPRPPSTGYSRLQPSSFPRSAPSPECPSLIHSPLSLHFV